MSSSSAERNPVERLAEEFAARQRRGERPSLTEYTDKYPQWADEIRDLFPALALVEQLKPQAADATGGYEPAPEPAEARPLERLGDYRILREVGRGGMGIVYEAEQESLGRHVALKVLPAHHLLDPRHLGRFQREARAAARLHHTNIVPVYGVGVHDSLHYYVMQFIQGQGLDQVLAELRRLRHTKSGLPAQPSDQQPEMAARTSAGSAAAVAQALLSGQFALPRPAADNGKRSARPEEAGGVPALSTIRAPQSAATGSSAVHLPGQPEHTTLSDSGRHYWQGVARVGIQVAEALAYAHGQGILHRDIKPSNLLVDTQGTVWITDFGLAKAAAEQDNLTHSGDIVGTLRYMAPERFDGRADLRSDLYALGLTLYELLALRPAFDEADRHKLVQQVMHTEPPRLRKLAPAVPRDLETIVHKVIDREPQRRYQTAQELAEDLKRFVEDKPIRARRISLAERLWRWSRRNPGLAGMAAVIGLVTALGLGGVLWQWRQAEQARGEAMARAGAEAEARQEAEHARGEATVKAEAERKARHDRERMLTDLYTSFGLTAGARDDPRQAVLWFAYAARLAGDDRERADANRTRAAAWGRQALLVRL